MKIGVAMFFTDYSMTPGGTGQGAGGTRLRIGVVARALPHPVIAQVGVPRRRRPAEEILRRDGPVRGADGRRRRHQDASRSAPASAWSTSAIRSRPPSSCLDRPASDGRFLFGVGNGWNKDEMRNHGTVFETRHKLVRERIEAMKVIWTKSKAEYHGEWSKFDPMMAWPKPAQKPHPPILVGGAFPVRRAPRHPLRRRLDAARARRKGYPEVRDLSRSSARWRRRPTAISPPAGLHLGARRRTRSS